MAETPQNIAPGGTNTCLILRSIAKRCVSKVRLREGAEQLRLADEVRRRHAGKRQLPKITS